MKNLALLTLVFLVSVISYGQDQKESDKKTQVEINYFHRTERCKTCNSIETNIEKVIQTHYADELKSGKLVFNSINYEGEESLDKIEKYEVEDPTLVITKTKKGKETTKDLTDFAFDKSLNEGKVFRAGLQEAINEMFR